MSDEVLQGIADNVLSSAHAEDRVTVLWHAGEPLVAPVSFYERALEILSHKRSSHQRLEHAVQTNGTLINNQWAEFFSSFDVSISVSIDGPAWLHDKRRRNRAASGTHAAVMRGVETLQRHKVPFSVICVVTRDTLNHPEELAAFFNELGAESVGFNPTEGIGSYAGRSDWSRDDPERYRAFLDRYLNAHAKSKAMHRIRDVDVLLELLKGTSGSLQNSLCIPFRYVTVGYDGRISTFTPDVHAIHHQEFGEIVFGSCLETDCMSRLSESETFLNVAQEIELGVRLCQAECDYFEICGGGDPASKYFEAGTFAVAETMSCRMRVQAVADALFDRISQNIHVTSAIGRDTHVAR
jgi:uncharacterized protein